MELIEFNSSFFYFLILLTILNFLIIEILLKKIKIKKLIDFPDNIRKIHKVPVAKVGGIVLILNLIFCSMYFQNYFIEINFISLIILLFFIGLFDDIFNLNPYVRLIFIIFFVIVFLLLNKNFLIEKIYFEALNKHLLLGKYNYIITLFCIVAIINAFNLFDGLNGLSLGYFIIIFCFLLIKFSILEFLPIILICCILFFYNSKNKLFLGDSGVYTLSSYLGFKLIEIHNMYEQNLTAEIIFLLLMIPGIDMARLFFERAINKKMFLTADKKHLHHYLFVKFGNIKSVCYLILFLLVPLIIYEAKLIPISVLIILKLIIYIFVIIYLKKHVRTE